MADSEVTFLVRGVESGDDARAVEDELRELRGVQMAEVDPESGRAEVRYGEELLSEERIETAIRDAGYEVDEEE